MAKLPQTLTPQRVNSILNFIKPMVSKTIYKAISLLLTPCCTNSIISATASCDPNNTGNYIVTITLAEPINLLGNGEGLLLFDNVSPHIGNEEIFTWPDTNTITLTNVNIAPLSLGTASISLLLFLTTGGIKDALTVLNAPDNVFLTFISC